MGERLPVEMTETSAVSRSSNGIDKSGEKENGKVLADPEALEGPGLPLHSADERLLSDGLDHQSPEVRKTIRPVIIIPIWIALSSAVILLNKHIFTNLEFPYPVFLTDYHMVIATIGTRILRFGPERFPKIKADIPWETYRRTIIPLGALFSASLILSNVAYVHLSVSFVQMLKAFIPILTLVIQLVLRLQEYNHLLLGVIIMTCLGCSIAAAGEMRFDMFGFGCQSAAVVVESSRLVLIQILLKDFKMDPLSSIAMYAPVCVAMISCFLPISEGLAPFHELYRVGAPMLVVNGLVAFSLNVAGVFLIDSAGSLVLTLSGVTKDILLITSSVILGSSITFTQVIGYTIALCGLILFRITGGSTESPIGARISGTFTGLTGR